MTQFSWGRVPEQLTRDLVRELALDASVPPEQALRHTFGAEPGTDFLRVAWRVLLPGWLGTDSDARTDIVAQLRAAGLGDHEMNPRGRASQLAYLGTCRNTIRLREIVRERFLEIGHPAGDASESDEPIATGTAVVPIPAAGPSADPTDPDHDVAATDLRAKVESAWSDLGKALSGALSWLPLDAHLVLTLDPTAGGTGDATYYVEFATIDEGELHGEAVGNMYLPAAHRLDRDAIADLVALGWSPPGVVEGTEGNFGLRAPVTEASRLAAIAVRTLREVYGAPHPAFVTYAVHALEDNLALPDGLGAARPEAPEEGSPVPEPLALGPDAPLPDRVRAVVAEVTETDAADLPVDADGEISVRSGSAMVFVRITADPSLVEVYSPVLTQVRPTQRLYERLSQLTRNMPIGRVYLDDDTVWASLAVFGRDFQPSHLSLALKVMTGLADTLDDRLQGDFGGRVFFGDTLPERREAAASEASGERTGMYL
ncbi:MAG: hypothetical protein JWO79_956 [Actinomycetia bacterium]|nr:hypothetical protein [Actinomycetes bacterium]MDQ1657943.1 hypothetical protein [Cryptosporangiaceae bacterium]